MSDSIMASWEHEAVSITITWGRSVALTRSIAVVVVIARSVVVLVAVRTTTAVSVGPSSAWLGWAVIVRQ